MDWNILEWGPLFIHELQTWEIAEVWVSPHHPVNDLNSDPGSPLEGKGEIWSRSFMAISCAKLCKTLTADIAMWTTSNCMNFLALETLDVLETVMLKAQKFLNKMLILAPVQTLELP